MTVSKDSKDVALIALAGIVIVVIIYLMTNTSGAQSAAPNFTQTAPQAFPPLPLLAGQGAAPTYAQIPAVGNYQYQIPNAPVFGSQCGCGG